MAQEHIDFTTPGGDTVTQALHKAEDNFNDLYAQLAAVVPYGGLRNLIINGDGRFNQRVFAGGALAANTYGYDRWRALGSASAMTVGASTISLQGTNCQVIEAPDLANATVTVSVTNPSGPINVSLQPDGTTATTATGVIPAGAGIQKVTLSVPATLTGNVFVLLAVAGTVTIDGPSKRAGIQVELGSVASPFERRHSSIELLLCQRFYEKNFDLNVAPGSVTANSTSSVAIGGLTSGSNLGEATVFYKVSKRTSPTITVYSPATGAAGKVRDYNSSADLTVSVGNNGANGFIWWANSSGSTGVNFGANWAVNAEF